MAINKKQTSKKVASQASVILKDKNTSPKQKSLAGSAMSQSKSPKQTGKKMETPASKALSSKQSSSKTKSQAGSVLSQSNKKR